MRRLAPLQLLSALLAAVSVYGQVTLSHPTPEPAQSHRELTPESYRRAVIDAIMQEGTPIKRARLLHRMGDDAAVNVLRVIGEKQSLTPTQKETILAILETAFQRPESISNANDKEPRVTLFVLQWISASAENDALKRQATQTRQKVLEAVK